MRAANTYRGMRRNDWRKLVGVTWSAFNKPAVDEVGLFGTFVPDGHRRSPSRSKYMPHIGAKERGRYA